MGIFGNHVVWVILLVIVLIIFGPGKLPQLGSAVGSALREFRKATNELREEVAKSTATPEPGQPDAPKEATGAPKA